MISPENWERFFAALAESGTVKLAAAASGIHRSTIYVHLDAASAPDAADTAKAWLARYKAAERAAVDTLEAEAFRRAHDGCRRKLYTKDGRPIIDPETGQHAYEINHSDSLTMFLLRARDPAKYKDRVAQEVSGPGGKPIQTEARVIAVPAIEEGAPE